MSTLPYNGLRWEFGAYQLGLDNIESRDSGVLIANDTFGRNYPFFADELRRFSALVLQARHSALATAVGSVEDKGCEFSLCNIGFRAWVRSNLFYLNGPAIQALDGRVFEPEIFQAPTASQGRLRINLPASPGFADYITAWMAPTPSKHNWLGHTGRSEAPDQVLRDKTGSILLEKRMSSRLLAAGGALLRCNLPESAWHRLRLRVYLRLRRLRGS
ncbi:MAG TPA: hypothetical protein VGE47_01640 [Burkholderiaceae bacterium]